MRTPLFPVRLVATFLAGVAAPVFGAPNPEMTIEEMEQALGLEKIDAKGDLRFRAPSFDVEPPPAPPAPASSEGQLSAGGASLAVSSGRFSLPVEFAFGSSQIAPTYWPTISNIADLMKRHGGLSLIIRGHTDSVGSSAANDTLSRERAASVGAALQSLGISGNRLRIEGRGEREPTPGVPGDDGKNRRVEFIRIEQP